MFKRLFFFLIFAVLVLSVVGFWYYERNKYSKESLYLELIGPDNPQALEEVEYLVKYKNNANIALEDIRITFEYPRHAILPEGHQYIETELADSLYPGQENTISFKARLLGAERDKLTARVKVTYRLRNIKARYEAETTHTAVISGVPLTLELDIPSRIDSERLFSFWINYFSSVDYPLSGLRIRTAYPSGFSFVDSRPQGLDRTEWEIPVLNKAEGGRIEVRGILRGDIYEQKNFKAVIGIVWNDEFIPLKETLRGVAISKPSLYITQTVNGSPDYIAEPGELLHYEIIFRNTGDTPFENLFLTVRLEGSPYDLQSIRAERGNFAKGDNSILWDWQKVPELRFLGPGEEGRVDFWIKLKNKWDVLGAGDKNFAVRDIVSLAQAREEFLVKVKGQLVFEQLVYFQDEIFGNTGPMPPEPGRPTTFTVVWRASSLYNDALDARARAILPENVRLTGKIFPEGSRLTFDNESREVVWEAGVLLAKAPGEGESSSVAFQIELIPKQDQEGKIMPLIGKAQLTATDAWTQKQLIAEDEAVDTTLPDDLFVHSKTNQESGTSNTESQ